MHRMGGCPSPRQTSHLRMTFRGGFLFCLHYPQTGFPNYGILFGRVSLLACLAERCYKGPAHAGALNGEVGYMLLSAQSDNS